MRRNGRDTGKVSALDPAHVGVAPNPARIRTSRGRFAEARRGLETALPPTEFTPAIPTELALLLIEAGEHDTARTNLGVSENSTVLAWQVEHITNTSE